MASLNVSAHSLFLDLQQRQISVAGPDYPQKFDFSLMFEYIVLSILPSSMLLILAPVRLWSLLPKATCAHGPIVRSLKLVSFAISQDF